MSVKDAILRIQERIDAACHRSGRSTSEVRLMGVSKFHSAEEVIEAYDASLTLFGESRVQEAVSKFPGLIAARPDIELHLIGSLQRNKAKIAVELFNCVQSVDRDELIVELGKRARNENTTIEILLELHTGEDSKAGYPNLDALYRGVELALSQDSLRLKGLMTMAPYTSEVTPIRASFRTLRSARDELASRFPQIDWSILSMGMSNDFEIAVEEGSTLVRVGTAIFGGGKP